MFERFTDRARRVVVLAQENARTLKHPYIGGEHLLLGLIGEADGVAGQALHRQGADLDSARRLLAETAPPADSVSGHIPFTASAKKALEMALREALQLGHNYIGTEHILLGLLREDTSPALALLAGMNIDPVTLRGEVIRILKSVADDEDDDRDEEHHEPTSSGRDRLFGGRGKDKTAALEAYGRNLTQAARDGKLDPVIGRDTEIERVMQILARRTKNNPVLIGEPGVGKTAVVEGLAARVAAGHVPTLLEGKQVISVDLAGMLAGTRYRGEFEERIKKLIKEVTERDDVVLFIDEIHTLVGAGAGDGAMDAANILKPMLSRGELRLIGATTLDEYRKHVEKDAALERRFQPVTVEAPDVTATIAILHGLRDEYARHHDVTIDDDALVAAAKLTDRYVVDRNLPDKAIDVLDEAGARLRLRRFARTADVRELDTRIAEARDAKGDAIGDGDDDRAQGFYQLEQTLTAERDALLEAHRALEPHVTAETIAEVVAVMTGIPVTALTDTETARLLDAEKILGSRVIGQDPAVAAVARTVRRTRAGLKDPRRPAGSFIFAGPSGVGKSELAKALAEFLHGDEDALISVDMSEFGEAHTAARLFGAPPGYVGHDEGGQLTEKVRRRPFSVVLFDEVEKAHPDIFNTLLQVLDEGRLTDGQGRVVDFKNTILIMTTNLGTRDAGKAVGFSSATGTDRYDRMQAQVHEQLKGYFRPEFLNRIDETIVFSALEPAALHRIVDLMTSRLDARLREHGMSLTLTPAATARLADLGYDPVLGARPLRRTIQTLVENPISEAILLGDLHAGQIVLVDVAEGEHGPMFTFTGTDTAALDALTGTPDPVPAG